MRTSNIRCQRCGEEFQAKRSDAKWCSQCRVVAHEGIALRSETKARHPCPDCGIIIARTSTWCRPCCQKYRAAKISGENNYAWKGGRTQDKNGYIYLLVAPEARKGHRYYAEHILVGTAANGPIPKGHVVHHPNHIKDDNRLENLIAMPRSAHNIIHGEQRILELEAEVRRLREELSAARR